ncbi:unnamed protein product [Ilex paraguariensis]|uniref:Rho GDP-dissociation inhibitor 1 n=1 Tax=Ilex paraguariensis TaxID=185542 RepID=A0ABC8QU45_9AQUA
MSLAVGAVSSSKNMGGFDENKEVGREKSGVQESGDEREENMKRTMSESSFYTTDNEEDEEGNKIELGPQYTIKEQLEKDKDDESLRRWKEQLLGSVDMNIVGGINFVDDDNKCHLEINYTFDIRKDWANP